MKTSRTVFQALFVLVIIGLAFSCQRTAERTGEEAIEKSIEQSTGEKADVDLQEGSGTITTESGTVKYDSKITSWPSDIPDDVPEFTAGRIEGGTLSDGKEGKSWTLMIKDYPDKALEDYNKALKSNGFETHIMTIDNKGGTITAEKGNLTVAFMGGEGRGSLSVQLKEEK